MRALRLAAVIEAGTLVVLLVNLLTAHTPTVSEGVGPLHGTAYLIVIVAVLTRPGARQSARWSAILPGVGGLLALHHISSRPAPGSAGRSPPAQP
jgi:hypothetical protein